MYKKPKFYDQRTMGSDDEDGMSDDNYFEHVSEQDFQLILDVMNLIKVYTEDKVIPVAEYVTLESVKSLLNLK